LADFDIFSRQHHEKKLDVSDCSLAHLILILLLRYSVKCRSCSLTDYNNEYMLGSTCRLGNGNEHD